MDLLFIIPGDINLPTGGYRYDRQLIECWKHMGINCTIHSLEGEFPFPTSAQRKSALDSLSQMPNYTVAVVDGLAGGAMPELLEKLSNNTQVVSLIHHPLCLENGLSEVAKVSLKQTEQAGLDFVRGVVTTSPNTKKTVKKLFGYPVEQIRTVLPGVARGNVSIPKTSTPVNLICVGSLIERKGHLTLIEALSKLSDLDWMLHCYGSVDKESQLFKKISDILFSCQLRDRVVFHGGVTDQELEDAYSSSDIFVLPSLYEGYGMAYAEAMVRGLPIIGTTAGAIPETVPETCGILVTPGHTGELSMALRTLIEDPNKRQFYHQGALSAAENLPSWKQSAEKFVNILEEWG